MQKWGPDSRQCLQLDRRSEKCLNYMRKIAAKYTMTQADKVLGIIFLERIRQDKRGSSSLLMITTNDWFTLFKQDCDNTVADLDHVADLSAEERVKYNITGPVSMFEVEPQSIVSAGRRSLRKKKRKHDEIVNESLAAEKLREPIIGGSNNEETDQRSGNSPPRYANLETAVAV